MKLTLATPWKIVLIAGVILLAGILIVAGWWISPGAKGRVIRALEEKYDSDVEITDLSIGLFPAPNVTLQGLKLRRHKDPTGQAPMIAIRKAQANTGWLGVLRNPKRVTFVRVEGLEITLARGRDKDDDGQPDQAKPKKPAPFVVEEMVADGTVLNILPKDPEKQPLVWNIYKLKLKSIGPDRPMHYDAQLRNAKPPGLIDANGEFGPWDADEPRRTAVSGKYKFQNADLGDFKGISGKLSSTGEYRGVLEKLEVKGQTDTPDFTVTSAGNPVHLKTEFEATVDGTNGDTLLHPVIAHFGSTTVKAEGGVTGTRGQKGKTVRLDSIVQDGDLADVLRLGVKNRPPMTGRISFQSLIEIPPGDRDIMDKMRLDGKFEIESGKFTSAQTQQKIAGLSERAQGDPEGGGDSDVLTDLRGRFVLSDGVIKMQGLQFAVPGAKIQLNGTYSMRGGALDFRGTATMDAKISEMTTGWKSFLLKALDPVFKKQHAGAVIPIHIGGTRQQPSFGLSLGRK